MPWHLLVGPQGGAKGARRAGTARRIAPTLWLPPARAYSRQALPHRSSMPAASQGCMSSQLQTAPGCPCCAIAPAQGPSKLACRSSLERRARRWRCIGASSH